MDRSTLPPPTEATDRPAGRVELCALAAVLLMAVAHAATTVFRTPGSYLPWADFVLYVAIFVGAGIVCLGRARRQPSHRWAWTALGVSLFLTSLGEAYFSVFLRDSASPAYPSPADWFWLAFYPAAIIGLFLLLRGHVRRPVATMWLDALISGLGVTAIVVAFGLDRFFAVSAGSFSTALADLAYPVGELLLITMVVAVLVFGGIMDRTWILLASAFSLFSAATIVYALQSAAGTYVEGVWTDALWPAGAALVAVSAVARPPAEAPDAAPWWRVMIVPCFFALGSLALLTYGQRGGVPMLAVALAIASLLVGVVRANLNYWEACRLLESRQQARTDELTGLHNRRGFTLELEATLRDRPEGQAVAVLLIDLDRFKEINDALGHAVGDELLALVGPRVRDCLRESDLLARLGGDEFAIVLAQETDPEGATVVAERIAQALTTPFDLPGISLHIGASIGIAICPEHGTDGPGLLRKADVAMYDAKGNGGGYRLYNPARDSHSRDRLRTIEQLRDAITRRQLVLHYQPKVDLVTGDVLGVEALVRWRHPERGLLEPEQFLQLAEQTGLMRPLTDHVLDVALTQLRSWRDQGWDLSVAVNISASNLLDVGLPLQVASKLSRHGIRADLLHLEITESTIMADPVRARQVVANLHDHGVLVSVDDYGTGYSSLAYLRHLSVRELKLDRGFVKDVCRDPRASAIVRSTVDLAHSLGLHMVAEGVEDAESARKLTEFGCDIAQGFHYSRPVSAADLGDWLRDRHGDRSLPTAG